MPQKLEPGLDHPITIEPAGGRVVVKAGGRTIVDTVNALKLKEASYPAVLYVPRADADMTALTRTEHISYCPYKGQARYFSAPGDKGGNAVWSYEAPYDAVAAIRDHLAFYPDRVDSIAVS